ncbi:2-O-methyltransferase NoeI [Vibrio cholerae]|nr:putative monosaccharide biosynthesis protein [Vibrio cholerae]GHZ26231.1 2-O-methyltransferase NoeI [Vibrio cholerae]
MKKFNVTESLKAIFNKNESEERSPAVVLDIGCRWGFADKFSDDITNGEIKVYGFDPDVKECENLKERYKNLKNVQLVPVGLSDSEGRRILYFTNEPACSSLYEPISRITSLYPALDCAKTVKQFEVDVTTLDLWCEKEGLSNADYIKIDTQGSELNILKGGMSILKTTRYLEVEVEFNRIYEEQPIFSDVDKFLREQGFVLWRLSNLSHYSMGNESEIIIGKDHINYDDYIYENDARGGQLFWADAFYVKEDIINLNYKGSSRNTIRNDALIAERLGFKDLSLRIKNYEIKLDKK